MEAAPDGFAEEEDDQQGIDQKDILYRMVFFPTIISSQVILLPLLESMRQLN
jgi:hypothetical protein